MEEILLHTGHGHPNLVWIVIASILSFAAGTGVGTHIDRLRTRMDSQDVSSTEKSR